MKENSLTKVNPKLAQEWHPTANGVITPNEVTAHCNKKYVWLCNRGHSFEASPENRLRGAGCPYCSGRRLLVGFNDLQTVCPKIINEWDFDNNKLLPNEITYNTTKRANWVCAKCGNKWNAPIRNRTKNNKTGCPKCAVINRGLKKHLSALEHNGHIDKELLLKEWDYEKNKLVPENYTKASNKEVFWICSKCGYSFKAKISNRYYRKGGCPCCSNKVIVVGVNDLATTHPRLAKEWDYERNGNLLPQDVTYGRANKVWWKCPEGHSYKATVLHRASGGTNCPKCVSGRQTSFAEQALFFYVKKLYPDAINRYTDIFPKGMELDVFIPSIRLGIEYDVEAWHKKDKRDREKKK